MDAFNVPRARLALSRLMAAADFASVGRRRVRKHPWRNHCRKDLYFMRCGDAVKIGVSTDPDSRLTELQTGAPGKLELLAVIRKAGATENECHRRLAHLRLHGEWFRYTPEVDALIEELLD